MNATEQFEISPCLKHDKPANLVYCICPFI